MAFFHLLNEQRNTKFPSGLMSNYSAPFSKGGEQYP